MAEDNDKYPLTLEGQTKRMRDGMARGEDASFAVGAAYRAILDGHLAEQAGYKNAKAYFAKQFGKSVSNSTLKRCGNMPIHFTQEDCEKYTTTNLNLLLTLAEAVEPGHGKIDPATYVVRVPVQDAPAAEAKKGKGTEALKAQEAPPTGDGVEAPPQPQVVEKPFPACSGSELNAAIRLAKRGDAGKAVPPEDTQKLQQYQSALNRIVGEHITLKASGKHGILQVSLDSIPLAILPQVIRALASVDEDDAPQAVAA